MPQTRASKKLALGRIGIMVTKNGFFKENWWKIVLTSVMLLGQVATYVKLQADVEHLKKDKATIVEIKVQEQKIIRLQDDVKDIKDVVNKIYEKLMEG